MVILPGKLLQNVAFAMFSRCRECLLESLVGPRLARIILCDRSEQDDFDTPMHHLTTGGRIGKHRPVCPYLPIDC